MKKILLLLFLLTGIAQAQIVNIPDANFKARLLSASPAVHVGSNVNPDSSATPGIYTTIDTNGDGEIQVTEAQNIIYLRLATLGTGATNHIASLQGIEAFTNLQTLYCSDNHLTTLNLDGMANLKFVNCSKNWLTSISTVGCTALTGLSIQNNALTGIDVTTIPNLQTLTITHNSVTSLDLSSLQNLWIVEAGFNNMTSFSLSNKNFLTTLNLGYNQLTSVQLTDLPHLYKVNVQNNQLTELDLSTVAYMPYINNIPQAYLYEIECNNNTGLNHINLKNGYLNQDIDLMSSSLADNMQYICNDDGETFNYFFANTGSLVSTYCNYTPGGNYNTISGNMIFDSNNNGCDLADLPQSFIKVKINDGTNEGAAFVNEFGDYIFYTQAGNFTLTPDVENPAFYTFSPPSALVNFPDNNNNTATEYFCITANGIHPDLEIVIAPITPARPGFDAVYKVVYKNKGNQVMAQSYGINFMYNQNVMNFVSASQTPASQGPGAISWDYANLMPFESRSITITMHVNSPTASVPVNINDILQLTATVLPMAGDETTTDNLFQFNQTVVGSFDPNDKICIEGVSISPIKIGEYLHYVINFENTGTAPAENIVVKDIIDTDKYDEKTLQVLDSSHPVTARISGNKAEFIFPNINLGYGGHGNILLKIKTRDNLANGDAVENKADIFFDYNAPIVTNVARTTFQSLGIDENTLDNPITVYPNPTDHMVHIKSLSTIQSVQLFDVQGRLLMARVSGETQTAIDLASRASGVYFVKIITEKGTQVERIVRK
ncbi:DUF7619 domain-containing protein [Flavobacterium humi]|uniref:T9SS type A sorting domain-containing protein n=1 Tax=Flavobacterium humi TaxID=2562683 RepID=A0A4Z0L4F6_9FLAO|nr:T9SS type A sorting domain-containing protein [Flavobacterium humi]TGD57119.1 T9SS type A sorting domain-containing protein [Flavobacterium humi]